MGKKTLIRNFIPKKLLPSIKDIFYNIQKILYAGSNFHCPCCDRNYSKFLNYGKIKNILCPGCASLGRHRLLWLYLKNETNILNSEPKILHFAPEHFLQKKLKKINPTNYVSADIEHPLAMKHFDITKIPYKNNSFDFILCSHVLQEVKNDKLAMSEIHRVLNSNGTAIILCPVNEKSKTTYENKKAKTPKQRSEEFGYYGAIRTYGKDFKQKLKNAGFKVKTIDYIKKFTKNQIKNFRLNNEKIYLCKK